MPVVFPEVGDKFFSGKGRHPVIGLTVFNDLGKGKVVGNIAYIVQYAESGKRRCKEFRIIGITVNCFELKQLNPVGKIHNSGKL